VAVTLVKAGADPTLADGKQKESEETKVAVERAIAETTITSVLKFQQELWFLQQKRQRSFQAMVDGGDHGDCGGAALEGTLDAARPRSETIEEAIVMLDARQRSEMLRADEASRAAKNFARAATALATQARDRGLRDQPLLRGTRVNVPAMTKSDLRAMQAAAVVVGGPIGLLGAMIAGELYESDQKRGVYERWEKNKIGANDHYMRFTEGLENYPLKKMHPDKWSITPAVGPIVPDPELKPMPPFPTFMLDWVLIGQHDKGIEGEKCGPEYATEEQVRKACTQGEHLGYYMSHGELSTVAYLHILSAARCSW
jgi:hypothetical protein